MIIADLGSALVAMLRGLVADGALPAAAAGLTAPGTWRTAPDGDPASFVTSLPFPVARAAGRQPGEVAAMLTGPLRDVPWIGSVSAASGYLTITVTPDALAAVPGRIAAAGPSAARSTALRGSTAAITAWPDLAAMRSWPDAWRAHAAAMTGRLRQAAGADSSSGRERGLFADSASAAQSPVRAAVAWFGVDAVRYCVARVLPGGVRMLAGQLRVGGRMPEPVNSVQAAHANAASALRWAADLRMERAGYTDQAGPALSAGAERALLGLLCWLPERVASAGRRSRPDELPRYLEQVAASWQACSQDCPALPFGGMAAPRAPAVAGARLLLAEATKTVLGAGLALTGVTPADRL